MEGPDEDLASKFCKYFSDKFIVVGDLSTHPITEAMQEYEVTEDQVSWREMEGEGLCTPYTYDKLNDREGV